MSESGDATGLELLLGQRLARLRRCWFALKELLCLVFPRFLRKGKRNAIGRGDESFAFPFQLIFVYITRIQNAMKWIRKEIEKE